MAWDREKDRRAGKNLTVGSSILGIAFGIFWCIAAASMGAWFMLLFGVPLVGLMGYRLYAMLQHAKQEEQPSRDPAPPAPPKGSAGDHTCPYCGGQVQAGFAFCPSCGRRQS